MAIEQIVSVAIQRANGVIYSLPSGGTHFDLIQEMCGCGVPTSDVGNQGYITSNDRFIGFREAKLIAELAGQTPDSHPFLWIAFA